MTVGKNRDPLKITGNKLPKKEIFNYISTSGDRGNFIFLMLKNPKNSKNY